MGIVSDRDKVFLSLFWLELFRLQGTKLKRSTANHPQSDGQSEVVNRSLETYLRCFTSEEPKQWARWLSWAEYWYNTSYHSSLQTTPFKVLYGRDPPPLVYRGKGTSASFEVDKYMEERDRILTQLKMQLTRAQQVMKEKADQHRREVSFQVGDKVYLKLRPYRQQSVAGRVNQKLSPRYYGPYEVLERIGQVAYKLRLPAHSSIHPVFHISQLKKAIGDHQFETQLPESIAREEGVELLPEKVEAVRTRKEGERIIQEVLIKWQGLPTHESSWETFDGMKLQFPDFHLEDKVKVLGTGIDTDRYIHVYNRRHKR